MNREINIPEDIVKRYVTEVHVTNIVLLPNGNRQEATQQENAPSSTNTYQSQESTTQQSYAGNNYTGGGDNDLPF